LCRESSEVSLCFFFLRFAPHFSFVFSHACPFLSQARAPQRPRSIQHGRQRERQECVRHADGVHDVLKGWAPSQQAGCGNQRFKARI